jgi:calcium-dependent protein kinase
LGKGAYGTVYKAQTKDYPNTVRAIKVIKKKNVKNQQTLIDEVTILRECDHPSIVKMYETYEDDQYLCMVLE